MEKNYFYNLYKNSQKYNIKINNNPYIINKINKINNLHGGVDNEEARRNVAALDALLNDPTQSQVPQLSVDPRDTLIQELMIGIEEFLRNFEEYKQNISSKLPLVHTEDELKNLEKIESTFKEIEEKIKRLV
jgi:hypothetical protein